MSEDNKLLSEKWNVGICHHSNLRFNCASCLQGHACRMEGALLEDEAQLREQLYHAESLTLTQRAEIQRLKAFRNNIIALRNEWAEDSHRHEVIVQLNKIIFDSLAAESECTCTSVFEDNFLPVRKTNTSCKKHGDAVKQGV